MVHTEVAQFFISLLRALIELAMLALAGQGLLSLLAGARRTDNPIWQLLRLIASPAVVLVRRLMPLAILDRHVPLLTFALLLWLWLFLAWLKQ